MLSATVTNRPRSRTISPGRPSVVAPGSPTVNVAANAFARAANKRKVINVDTNTNPGLASGAPGASSATRAGGVSASSPLPPSPPVVMPLDNEGRFALRLLHFIGVVGDGVVDAVANRTRPRVVYDKLQDALYVDEEKFSGTTIHRFRVTHPARRAAILLVCDSWFRRVMVAAYLFHSLSVLLQDPARSPAGDAAALTTPTLLGNVTTLAPPTQVPPATGEIGRGTGFADGETWILILFDRLLLLLFAAEIAVQMLAHGVKRYLTSAFGALDVAVAAFAVALELVPSGSPALVYLFALNALRPVRAVHRVPGMRKLVTGFVASLPTMASVLVLMVSLVVLFAMAGVILFSDVLHSRCRDADLAYSSVCSDYNRDPRLAWLFAPCDPGSNCTGGAPAPNVWGNFDNVGVATLLVVQVMTLDNWSAISEDVMNGWTPAAALYFVLLTVVGGFWALNLVLAVITDSFSRFFAEEQIALEERLAAPNRGAGVSAALAGGNLPPPATGAQSLASAALAALSGKGRQRSATPQPAGAGAGGGGGDLENQADRIASGDWVVIERPSITAAASAAVRGAGLMDGGGGGGGGGGGPRRVKGTAPQIRHVFTALRRDVSRQSVISLRTGIDSIAVDSILAASEADSVAPQRHRKPKRANDKGSTESDSLGDDDGSGIGDSSEGSAGSAGKDKSEDSIEAEFDDARRPLASASAPFVDKRTRRRISRWRRDVASDEHGPTPDHGDVAAGIAGTAASHWRTVRGVGTMFALSASVVARRRGALRRAAGVAEATSDGGLSDGNGDGAASAAGVADATPAFAHPMLYGVLDGDGDGDGDGDDDGTTRRSSVPPLSVHALHLQSHTAQRRQRRAEASAAIRAAATAQRRRVATEPTGRLASAVRFARGVLGSVPGLRRLVAAPVSPDTRTSPDTRAAGGSPTNLLKPRAGVGAASSPLSQVRPTNSNTAAAAGDSSLSPSRRVSLSFEEEADDCDVPLQPPGPVGRFRAAAVRAAKLARFAGAFWRSPAAADAARSRGNGSPIGGNDSSGGSGGAATVVVDTGPTAVEAAAALQTFSGGLTGKYRALAETQPHPAAAALLVPMAEPTASPRIIERRMQQRAPGGVVGAGARDPRRNAGAGGGGTGGSVFVEGAGTILAAAARGAFGVVDVARRGAVGAVGVVGAAGRGAVDVAGAFAGFGAQTATKGARLAGYAANAAVRRPLKFVLRRFYRHRWRERLALGVTMVNTALLLGVHYHYQQPSWYSLLVEVVTLIVDVLIVLEAVAGVATLGVKKYVQRDYLFSTQNMTHTSKHGTDLLLVLLCFIDLVLVVPGVVPSLRLFRVLRALKGMRRVKLLQTILTQLRSSLYYLVHLFMLLVMFLLVFAVAGRHIFANIKPGVIGCHTYSDPSSCNAAPECLWVNSTQWLHQLGHFPSKPTPEEMNRSVAAIRRVSATFDGLVTMHSLPHTATAVVRGVLPPPPPPPPSTPTPPAITSSPFALAMRALSYLSSGGFAAAGSEEPATYSPAVSNSSEQRPSLQAYYAAHGFQCRQFGGWGSADGSSRFNFQTLLDAFIVVFNLVTKDNWSAILYRYMTLFSPAAVLFFFPVIFIGGYVLLSLLVAILLVNFGKEQDADPPALSSDDEHDDGHSNVSSAGSNAGSDTKERGGGQQKDAKNASSNDMKDPGSPSSTAFLNVAQDQFRDDFAADDPTPSHSGDAGSAILDNKDKSFRGRLAAAGRLLRRFAWWLFTLLTAGADTVVHASALEGSSFFTFRPSHPLRVFTRRVVSGTYFPFERTVYAVALLQCITGVITIELIESRSWMVVVLVCEWIAVIVNVFELFALMVTHGALMGPRAFWRLSGRAKFDFVVVVLSFFGVFLPTVAPDSVAIQSISLALRAWRPARLVARSRAMANVLFAVWRTVPAMLSVFGLSAAVYLLMSVMTVEAFQGLLRTCSDGSDRDRSECVGYYAADESSGVVMVPINATRRYILRRWSNAHYFHFDNSFNAFTTLVEISMVSSWSEVMFALVDAPVTAGGGPRRNNRPALSLFFVFWIFVGNWVLLNIFVGMVVDQFTRLKLQAAGSLFLTEEQTEIAHIRKLLHQTGAKKVLSLPATPFINSEVNRFCYTATTHPTFVFGMKFAVFLNVIVILLLHYGQEEQWSEAQFWSNVIFSLFFTTEFVLKILIAGPRAYLRIAFYRLDTIVVLQSWVELSLFLAAPGYRNSQTLQLLRLFRVLRLLREQRGFRRLTHTGYRSLPALGNIGALLVVAFYVFACIGMSLFRNVRRTLHNADFLTFNTNFVTFPRAMAVLFRVATLDNWGAVTAACAIQEPYCSQSEGNCGNGLVARIFFNAFAVTVALVMINLFIAVVLENFAESVLLPTYMRERMLDINLFRSMWATFDPQGRQCIPAAQFALLLQKLPGPRVRLEQLRGVTRASRSGLAGAAGGGDGPAGSSDPYVRLLMDGKQIWRSPEVAHSVNPEWRGASGTHSFHCGNIAAAYEIQLWDLDFATSEFLGTTTFIPAEMRVTGERTVRLQPRAKEVDPVVIAANGALGNLTYRWSFVPDPTVDGAAAAAAARSVLITMPGHMMLQIVRGAGLLPRDKARNRHAKDSAGTGGTGKDSKKSRNGKGDPDKSSDTTTGEDSICSWTPEEMEYYAAHCAIGLQGESTASTIPTLRQLNLLITMPRQEVLFADAVEAIGEKIFHVKLVDLPTSTALATARRTAGEYTSRWTICHYYCATVVQAAWRRYASVRHLPAESNKVRSKWNEILGPVLRQVWAHHAEGVFDVDESAEEAARKRRMVRGKRRRQLDASSPGGDGADDAGASGGLDGGGSPGSGAQGGVSGAGVGTAGGGGGGDASGAGGASAGAGVVVGGDTTGLRHIKQKLTIADALMAKMYKVDDADEADDTVDDWRRVFHICSSSGGSSDGSDNDDGFGDSSAYNARVPARARGNGRAPPSSPEPSYRYDRPDRAPRQLPSLNEVIQRRRSQLLAEARAAERRRAAAVAAQRQSASGVPSTFGHLPSVLFPVAADGSVRVSFAHAEGEASGALPPTMSLVSYVASLPENRHGGTPFTGPARSQWCPRPPPSTWETVPPCIAGIQRTTAPSTATLASSATAGTTTATQAAAAASGGAAPRVTPLRRTRGVTFALREAPPRRAAPSPSVIAAPAASGDAATQFLRGNSPPNADATPATTTNMNTNNTNNTNNIAFGGHDEGRSAGAVLRVPELPKLETVIAQRRLERLRRLGGGPDNGESEAPLLSLPTLDGRTDDRFSSNPVTAPASSPAARSSSSAAGSARAGSAPFGGSRGFGAERGPPGTRPEDAVAVMTILAARAAAANAAAVAAASAAAVPTIAATTASVTTPPAAVATAANEAAATGQASPPDPLAQTIGDLSFGSAGSFVVVESRRGRGGAAALKSPTSTPDSSAFGPLEASTVFASSFSGPSTALEEAQAALLSAAARPQAPRRSPSFWNL